jgi:hypothetical protein
MSQMLNPPTALGTRWLNCSMTQLYSVKSCLYNGFIRQLRWETVAYLAITGGMYFGKKIMLPAL